ncbi:MAG: putative metal-binding motif-containing protein [Alphaproteobacteria bacterium]|nr:putative metal-binding motif-containing protein [Alphaproteobacteria bacterium]
MASKGLALVVLSTAFAVGTACVYVKDQGAASDRTRTPDTDVPAGGQYDLDADGFCDQAHVDDAAPGACTSGRWGDCNDEDATIFPGAPEICNEVDDDCDGAVDDDDDLAQDEGAELYADADGDGYGDPHTMELRCVLPPSGWSRRSGDCDDADPDRSPGEREVCNGIDDDCDGHADDQDDDVVYTADDRWWFDADHDDHGDPDHVGQACNSTGPSGGTWSRLDDDCDDADQDVHPGATETCAPGDEDCDQLEGDADPSLDASTRLSWWPDADRDGHGDEDGTAVSRCVAPGAAWSDTHDDCDDHDAAVSPSALEQCTPGDEDCDGLEGDADPTLDLTTAPTWFGDDDGDGVGGSSRTQRFCQPNAPGWASVSGDCDDADPANAPGFAEVCDGGDNDCDRLADEDDPDLDLSTLSTWYADADFDGAGDPDTAIVACTWPGAPVRGVTTGGDCDDDDASRHPGALETCNGVDDDCDGQLDADDPDLTGAGITEAWADDDGDGHGDPFRPHRFCLLPPFGWSTLPDDCDDAHADAHPGAPEVCDGYDNDCDRLVDAADPSLDASTAGDWFPDGDGDGHAAIGASATPGCTPPDLTWVRVADDCDDADPARFPGNPEACDGLDEDCTGVPDDIDVDGDGVTLCAGDCDDRDPRRAPGHVERCDGVDDDCDGLVPLDEDDPDGDGLAACEGDLCADDGTTFGTDEILCNGVDDDCDGLLDPGCPRIDALTVRAWRGPGLLDRPEVADQPRGAALPATCASTDASWLSEPYGVGPDAVGPGPIDAYAPGPVQVAWSVTDATDVSLPYLPRDGLPADGTMGLTVTDGTRVLLRASNDLGTVEAYVDVSRPTHPAVGRLTGGRPETTTSCRAIPLPTGFLSVDPQGWRTYDHTAEVALCDAVDRAEHHPDCDVCGSPTPSLAGWQPRDGGIGFVEDAQDAAVQAAVAGGPSVAARHAYAGPELVIPASADVWVTAQVTVDGDLLASVGVDVRDHDDALTCGCAPGVTDCVDRVMAPPLADSDRTVPLLWPLGTPSLASPAFPVIDHDFVSRYARVSPVIEVDSYGTGGGTVRVDQLTLWCCGAGCGVCQDPDHDLAGTWCAGAGTAPRDCDEHDGSVRPGRTEDATSADLDCDVTDGPPVDELPVCVP